MNDFLNNKNNNFKNFIYNSIGKNKRYRNKFYKRSVKFKKF